LDLKEDLLVKDNPLVRLLIGVLFQGRGICIWDRRGTLETMLEGRKGGDGHLAIWQFGEGQWMNGRMGMGG
jgi:hypothetical protein